MMQEASTSRRALVPWANLEQTAARLGYKDWPFGLQIDVFSGERIPDELEPGYGPWGNHEGDVNEPPEDLATVEFFVQPYSRPKSIPLVKQMTGLKVAQSLRAGPDDLVAALPEHVTLCSARGVHGEATAEHGLALILAALRDFPRWAHAQQQRHWQQEFTDSLVGKRVLIAGYGDIGKSLERRLLACDAKVIRLARRARPAEQVHPQEDLKQLLPQVDVVVSILPDGPATRGIWNAEHLALLSDGALLVNIGRGSAVDEDALLAELQTGRIRAALDVAKTEPLPAENPLWNAPGLLITPHVAGGSWGTEARSKEFVVQQLRRYAYGQPLENVIEA